MVLVEGDRRKDCCKLPENLYVFEEAFTLRRETPASDVKVIPHAIVHKCLVCGCRHFEMSVEVGKLGLQGASVG